MSPPASPTDTPESQNMPVPPPPPSNPLPMSLPPFRLCASPATQGEKMPWVGAVTGRAYLLYRSLILYISTIFQDEKYRYNLTWRFIDWLAAHFKRLWPTIDPISNLVKRLYYEFSLEAGSMEYLWIQHWLNNRPSMMKEHRRVKVSTGNKQILGSGSLPKEPTEIRALRKTLGYKGLPYPGTSQWFMYQGGLFRTKTSSLPPRSLSHPDAPPPPFCDQDDIHVRLYARTRAPFLFLLAEAKKKYEDSNPSVIEVSKFNGGGWSRPKERQKRNFEDVILTEESRSQLDHLVEDFLRSGKWYLNRGLSWKKGILLHGPPGCGKTSTIVGLASKYDLKVFQLSLNHPMLSDDTLADVMRMIPQRSIVCFEDCDVWAAAHKRSLENKTIVIDGPITARGVRMQNALAEMRSASPPPPPPPPPSFPLMGPLIGPPPPPSPPHSSQPHPPPIPLGSRLNPISVPDSTLSLAGLLNVLDGVEEQKGILYILTSNDPSALDAALLRPGRVDCIIELRAAVRQQAEDLFNIFYKPYDEEVPGYDLSRVPTWAKAFARQVEDHEFSCASLQNFLLDHRTDPAGAIEAFPKWLADKRTQKPLGEHATDKAEAAQQDIKGADQ